VAYTTEIFTSSIVIVGDFNPVIFTPDWLERSQLIGEGDAIDAREGTHGRKLVVSHQITTYETEWFAIQVLENQFSLTSKGVLSPAFKDLASGIIELVSQTPVRAIGLNFIGHYKLASVEDYHKVGDVIAPKNVWSELYPEFHAGMEVLTIRYQHGTREEPSDIKDEKRITIQPSRQVKNGVSMLLNDHHDIQPSDDILPAENARAIIDDLWEAVWAEATEKFSKTLDLALKD
jgi:hypothetical protein